MAVSVRRLAESFVGEVSGVDLRRLDSAAAEAVKDAWLRHKGLVFHDQQLDEDQLVAFAETLGDVEIHQYPRLMRRVGINFPADLRAPF